MNLVYGHQKQQEYKSFKSTTVGTTTTTRTSIATTISITSYNSTKISY